MTPAKFQNKLDELRALPGETEWVEFKRDNIKPQEIGEYLSALSNAATLHGQPFGYIVWGIGDETHDISGTKFEPRRSKGVGNEDLEPWLARLLSPRVDFCIHEFVVKTHPVVMFVVQAANTTPVAFSGRRWIRIGSYKKPLEEYPAKEELLWQALSGPAEDWSAQICPDATLADLDPTALAFARQQYRNKHPNFAEDLDGWDNLTFLHMLRVAFNGRIKRAAIILLGREESVHYISPAVAHVTWILKDADGTEIDYAHFHPPFILKVEEVYKKVRNLTLRIMPEGSLFPREVTKYDDWVFREALHNCIAHQDYTRNGRIHLVEQDDSLLFTNLGSFIPGTVEHVIERDAPEEAYRNSCLATAMVSLKMIDTMGSGIKRMFRKQRERFLPMPDYDLSDLQRVKVRIIGKILNERFTGMLMSRTGLRLIDVILLDKVQKRLPISEDAYRSLKQQGLIEGRKATPFISAAVAVATEQEAEYIRNKGIEKDDCKRKVIEYLKLFAIAPLRKFLQLVTPHLSTTLNDRQKRDFVRNLLQEMRRDGVIQRIEGRPTKGAAWELAKPTTEDVA